MKQVFHYQIVTIIIFHFVIIYVSGQIWYKKPSSSAVNPIPAKTRKRSTCLLHVPRFYMIFNKLCQPSIKEKRMPNHHQHPLIFLKIRVLFYLLKYNRYWQVTTYELLVQDWNNCFGFPPIFVLTMTLKEPNANIIKISDMVIQKVLKIKQIASGTKLKYQPNRIANNQYRYFLLLIHL